MLLIASLFQIGQIQCIPHWEASPQPLHLFAEFVQRQPLVCWQIFHHQLVGEPAGGRSDPHDGFRPWVGLQSRDEARHYPRAWLVDTNEFRKVLEPEPGYRVLLHSILLRVREYLAHLISLRAGVVGMTCRYGFPPEAKASPSRDRKI